MFRKRLLEETLWIYYLRRRMVHSVPCAMEKGMSQCMCFTGSGGQEDFVEPVMGQAGFPNLGHT